MLSCLVMSCRNVASILSNVRLMVLIWCLRSNATSPYLDSMRSASSSWYSAIVMSRYVADSVRSMRFRSSVLAASACLRWFVLVGFIVKRVFVVCEFVVSLK